MKTMKLWRKSRLSECHANSFANGRTGTIYVIAFMMLAAFSLASCSSDDENKDIVDQVIIYVSAETGTYNNVPDNTYLEGMMMREQGENAFYCVSFQEITGFTYERGHEYELLVKRTTLANPPQDSGKYRYELVRIISDKVIKS